MTDIASLGIQLDTRQVADGVKVLDALGDSSVKVEAKVDSANKALDNMSTASANVWRRGTDATKGMDALGDSAAKTGQRISVSNGQMGDTAKILAQQAEQAKAAALANAALGGSTSQLTLGQQQLIEKFREQATTLGMSRSQLMAYQAAQMGLTSQVSGSIAVFKAQEDAIKAAAAAKVDAERSANRLAEAIKLLAAGYALLKVGEYIKEATMLAARYETLGVVMEVVGKNAGYTKTQMDFASQSVAKQGITMVESRESVVKLVQAHVDLAHASDLARIAQNAAVIGHINSSEAFDRLVNGIARGNVLILRNIGINVNLQSAYREMADSLGKTTKELTENERVEARRIAVFERGADINGVYEKSMDTAGKQSLSMQRYTQDFKTTFGETFNEALTIGVMGLTDHLKDSNKAITDLSKNNQLEEWGHGITRIFVAIVNTVSDAVTALQKVDAFARHMDARKEIGEKFDSQTASNISDSKLTTLSGVTDFYQKGKRIEAARQAALAEENVDYETRQAALSANFGRFQKAGEAREATRAAKHKADADERLKVDQDYATKATAIANANANKSVEIQQAAQMKLYKDTYVGTPQYRDTEGREPKPKVDAAENTRLADTLKRFDTEAAAAKAEAEYLMKIDDMRHRAGEMGDADYYANRKTYAEEITGAEVAAYDKQLAELRKHYNNTEGEGAKNAKAIHDIEDKKAAVKQKFSFEELTRDEEERLRQKAIVSASDDAANKYIDSLNAQIVAIEAANGKRGQSASAIAAETAAQLRAAAAAMSLQAAGPDGNGHTQADADAAAAMLITLNLQADAQERIANALRSGEAANASRKLADQAIQDWKNVGQSVGESLADAFGNAGKAAGGMFKAYADNASRQLQINKELALTKRLSDDDPEKVRNLDKLQRDSAASQLQSYGDMAGAAQGFFDQNSKGYAAMHAASMVLHGAEVALSLIKGVNAVLTQGEGDPYSAFARMAAMTALVVGLGVALTGGGGGTDTTAKDRQAATGTGTVLGDTSAKSDSIARAISLTAKNTSTLIDYTASMVTALNSIQTNIGNFASQVIQSTGISGKTADDTTMFGGKGVALAGGVGGAALGAAIGTAIFPVIGTAIGAALGALVGHTFIGKALSSIFGGSQSVTDTGLTATKTTLGQAEATGIKADQYTDVTTSGGWFRGDKKSTQLSSVGQAANDQFTLIVKSLADGVTEAAKLLGIGGDAFTQHLNQFVVDIGDISTKGLTGDEIQTAIQSAFSKMGDDMASWAVGGLGQFQKVGEGSLETLVRVATDYAKLDASLASVGATFGKTGVASIAARESLIALLGGIDNFQSTVADYSKNFLTQAEQLAPVAKYVNDQLGTMGLSWIKTRADFKTEIDNLSGNLSDAGAQKMYASLMGLESAFAAVVPAIEDTSKSMQEVADERKDLQDQLDTLTMTSAQLLAKQRGALDASNRSLFDQVQAATAAKTAQDALKTSLTSAVSSMKTFKDATQQLHDGLLTGSNSPLTPEQQYEESRRQYEKTKSAAMGGDTTAQGQYSAMLNSFLAASKVVNASDGQYSADFAETLADSDAMAKWAGTQVDTAQASLDALNAQVAGITDVNTSVLGVTAAVNQLTTTMGGTPAVTMPTPVLSAVTVNVDTSALQAQVASLQGEVAALRADQAVQTGDAIKGNADATANAATTVVKGTGSLAATMARAASLAKQEYA